MKCFLFLLFFIQKALCSQWPVSCQNIPIRLLANHFDIEYYDKIPNAKQMGRYCVQENYLDEKLICPDNVPDIFETPGIETYLTRAEREFLVEFRRDEESQLKYLDYQKKYPLGIYTNQFNYLEKERWSQRNSNFKFFLFNPDLTLQHFEFVTKNFIKLIADSDLELDCKKINNAYYRKNEVNYCDEEIVPKDYSSLKKWRGILKEIKYDDIRPFHVADRIEGIHNSVGIAFEIQYKTSSGKIVPRFMHTHYTSNPYYLYKILTRPPCPGWSIHKANFNYHNGSSAYAFYRTKEGHELSSPDVMTSDLLLYQDSIGHLYTKETELVIHSCRSIAGFETSKSDERIGNFLYKYTPAKITGFEKKSYPIRPIANPFDLGKSSTVQNKDFVPCDDEVRQ